MIKVCFTKSIISVPICWCYNQKENVSSDWMNDAPLADFVGDTEQSDDLTMLAIQWKKCIR